MEEHHEMQLEEIDILLHPKKALKYRIKMIPTLQIGEKRLSRVFLSSAQIKEFITSA